MCSIFGLSLVTFFISIVIKINQSQYANGKPIGGEMNKTAASNSTTTNFNSSTNPNNQAMALTSNDLKLTAIKS